MYQYSLSFFFLTLRWTFPEPPNMSAIITDCCGRGISFASMGQNCSGMAGFPDVAMENRAKCEAIFMSCCHNQMSSASCDEGILLQLNEGECESSQQLETCNSYSAEKVCDIHCAFLLNMLINRTTDMFDGVMKVCIQLFQFTVWNIIIKFLHFCLKMQKANLRCKVCKKNKNHDFYSAFISPIWMLKSKRNTGEGRNSWDITYICYMTQMQ